MRPERLDSDEESFDTKPLVERSGDSDGIVTTLGSEWGPLQDIEGSGAGWGGARLEEGVSRVRASHGSRLLVSVNAN